MTQFDVPFKKALTIVTRSCGFLVKCPARNEFRLFRYEDRFFDSQASIVEVGRTIGFRVSNEEAKVLFSFLRPRNVKKAIEEMARSGLVGRDDDGDRYDPHTQWHADHIGDRRVGKYRRVLTGRQRQAVVWRNRELLDAMGYRY